MTTRIAILLAVVSWLPAVISHAFQYEVTCGKTKNPQDQHKCKAGTDWRATLKTEISQDVCKEGSTWDYDADWVYTSGGCAGVFTVGRATNPGVLDVDQPAIGDEVLRTLRSASEGSPAAAKATTPPKWASGSFVTFDPSSGQQALLDIYSNGTVTLRNQDGGTINAGAYRNGMIEWNDGRKSPVFKEQPGLSIGLAKSATEFRFR